MNRCWFYLIYTRNVVFSLSHHNDIQHHLLLLDFFRRLTQFPMLALLYQRLQNSHKPSVCLSHFSIRRTLWLLKTHRHTFFHAHTLCLSLFHTHFNKHVSTHKARTHMIITKKLKKDLHFGNLPPPYGWKKIPFLFSLDTTKKKIKSIEMEILFRPLGMII